MKFNVGPIIERSRTRKLLRTTVVAAVSAALCLSFAAEAALGDEHKVRHAGEQGSGGNYESNIYGTVEKTPQDEIGTWIVNGRDIIVTRDTRIKEKHGKAEPGAYVKVEGNVTGKTFTAYEIEVKRSKQKDR
jgi:hypothetical protein